MRPMHWFWRAAIAAGVSCLASLVIALPISGLVQAGLRRHAPIAMVNITGIVLYSLVTACLALVVYSGTGRKGPEDGETRCRKCGYILRGITEPRCPECGERI